MFLNDELHATQEKQREERCLRGKKLPCGSARSQSVRAKRMGEVSSCAPTAVRAGRRRQASRSDSRSRVAMTTGRRGDAASDGWVKPISAVLPVSSRSFQAKLHCNLGRDCTFLRAGRLRPALFTYFLDKIGAFDTMPPHLHLRLRMSCGRAFQAMVPSQDGFGYDNLIGSHT